MGRTRNLRKTLIGIIVFLALSLFGTGTYAAYLMVVKPIASNVDKIGATNTGKVIDEVTEVEVEAAKPITILLLGIDNRPETGSLNSDIIMVASLNPETNSATVVSLPRDTYMTPSKKGIPSRKANYYYPYFHNQDKLTAYKNTRELLGEFFEVPIDAAVSVDFEGFRKMIDELGGVDVNVPMDMRYVDKADGTNINLRKGPQTLNGKQALDYVRYRKSNQGTAESSDPERNQRQHEVVDQMIGKVFSFGGVMKINKLMGIAGDHVQTDIPSSKLMDFFQKYIGIDRNKIKYISLEGKWISPYIELSDQEIEEARQALKDQIAGKVVDTVLPPSDAGLSTTTPSP